MSRDICFTPYSWAKLCYLRDKGNTEIGCFGVAETPDPLLLTDIFLPVQECTMSTVDLDGQSLLKYRARCRAVGLDEKHSFRVWIHTHPKMSAKPSSVDETTYNLLFANADWGIMLIVSKSGEEYARVRYGGDGPQADAELDIAIDYSTPFPASDHATWDRIYAATVTKKVYVTKPNSTQTTGKNGWKSDVKQKWVNGWWVDDIPGKSIGKPGGVVGFSGGVTGRWELGVFTPDVAPATGTGWPEDKADADYPESEAEFRDLVGAAAAIAEGAKLDAEAVAKAEAVYLESEAGTQDKIDAEDAEAALSDLFHDAEAETEATHRAETEGENEYEIRVMYCAACNETYETCDALDCGDDDVTADVCLKCNSHDIFEDSTYFTAITD